MKMNKDAHELIGIMESIGIESQARRTVESIPVVDTDIILDSAIKYLGDNYKEIIPGLFYSENGERIFRMLDNDLSDSSEPHVHFETRMGLNFGKKGLNYHIGLDE